jgi:molecular chaperone DnaJ
VLTVEILQVSDTATYEEIRRSYLQMAREYHPDVNDSPKAAEIFAKVNEAHETLKNAETRKVYDETGMTANE